MKLLAFRQGVQPVTPAASLNQGKCTDAGDSVTVASRRFKTGSACSRLNDFRYFLGFTPEVLRNREGIDLHRNPPANLVPRMMQLAMMSAAQRDRILVTDFTAHRTRLGKPKMVCIRRGARTHQAGLPHHVFEVMD